MSEIKLKPCPLCGRSDIKTETWASVKAEWNRKAGSNEKD